MYYRRPFAAPRQARRENLIIAEKPSVAADIARALGGFTRHDDHYESDRYVLSSAVGHLLELGMPEDEEVKRGKWTFAHLPAIPSRFELKPIEKNENRLKVLLKLLKRKDVAASSTPATPAARASSSSATSSSSRSRASRSGACGCSR